MSDIKILIPQKSEEAYVNYLCDKIKETIHNKKACIVIFDTPEGTNVSPSGSAVELITSLTIGALSTIDAISQRTKIPKQVLLDGLVHTLTTACNS